MTASSLQPRFPCLLPTIYLVSCNLIGEHISRSDDRHSAKFRGDNLMFCHRPAALCGRDISVNLLLQRMAS